MSRVKIVYRPEMEQYYIYYILGERDGKKLCMGRDSKQVFEIGENQEMPIYTTLSEPVIDAILEEFKGRKPAATEEHLNDAREVRDRLLTLVEASQMPRDEVSKHIIAESELRRHPPRYMR
jgi:hypothetical protein